MICLSKTRDILPVARICLEYERRDLQASRWRRRFVRSRRPWIDIRPWPSHRPISNSNGEKAINRIDVLSKDLKSKKSGYGAKKVELPGGIGSGNWKGAVFCPDGHYVCGIEQRVEDWLGGGEDDTGVGDLRIYCCPF